jgi:hypothetical protein
MRASRSAARGLDAVDLHVDLQRVVEHDQPREVQLLERAERNERVARIGDARRRVHRRQQRAQRRLLAGGDRRDHHEVVLRRHAQNCRQKSIRRSLAQ